MSAPSNARRGADSPRSDEAAVDGFAIVSPKHEAHRLLVRQYMLTVPDDLLEAARLDGAGEFRIFWSVVLPIALDRRHGCFGNLILRHAQDEVFPLFHAHHPHPERVEG